MTNIQSAPHGAKFFLRSALIICWVSFREITRDKIFYNTVLFALVLLGAGFLASQLTYGDPGRVVLDFGISAVDISCTAIGVILGANVLIREFDRRTALVALAHPISKGNFVFGKFLGVCSVLAVNWGLLAVLLIAILAVTGGQVHSGMQSTILAALFLIFWESIVMTAIAIFFSTFSTTSLAVIISVGFYLVGHSNSQLRLLASKSVSPLTKSMMNFIATLFPNLEHFSLGQRVTYGLPIEAFFVPISVVYALCWVGFLLVLSSLMLERRES